MLAVANLIKKDILTELRQKHVFMGLLLYVISTVFIVFLMNGQPDAKTWNALFWLVQLFVCVNAVAKSFISERRDRYRYYFLLVNPQSFVLAKLFYNLLLQLILCILSFLFFAFLLGFPAFSIGSFITVTFLGSCALSSTFTFLSAVAASAQQGPGLVAVLGFPLILPILLILTKLLNGFASGVVIENQAGLYVVLALMSLLIGVLAWILYPMMWKE